MNSWGGRRWEKGEGKGRWKKVYREEFEGFRRMVVLRILEEECRGSVVTKDGRKILRGLTQELENSWKEIFSRDY